MIKKLVIAVVLPVFAALACATLFGADRGDAQRCIAFELQTSRSGLSYDIAEEMKDFYFGRIYGLSRYAVLSRNERDAAFLLAGTFIMGEINQRTAPKIVEGAGYRWFITAGIARQDDGSVEVSVLLGDAMRSAPWVSYQRVVVPADTGSMKSAIVLLAGYINDPARDNPPR